MAWIRRLIERILRLFGRGGQPVPREPVSMAPIAVVRNTVFDPKPDGWENVRSDLIFRDDLLDAIDGLDEFSHVIVIFACHRVPDAARTHRLVSPGGAVMKTGLVKPVAICSRPNSTAGASAEVRKRAEITQPMKIAGAFILVSIIPFPKHSHASRKRSRPNNVFKGPVLFLLSAPLYSVTSRNRALPRGGEFLGPNHVGF